MRDVIQPTTRDLADDNDEFRELPAHFTGEGYPYTYPITYAHEGEPRELRELTDPGG